jgi:hypothetical protein
LPTQFLLKALGHVSTILLRLLTKCSNGAQNMQNYADVHACKGLVKI